MNQKIASLAEKKQQIVEDLGKLGYVVTESKTKTRRPVLVIGKKEGKK